MARKKRKFRSIDDTWEDSSEPKILDKPEIPKRMFSVKSRTIKPTEKYYYNALVKDHQLGESAKMHIMEVSEAIHKKILASMTAEPPTIEGEVTITKTWVDGDKVMAEGYLADGNRKM